jgi:hypothetical protein
VLPGVRRAGGSAMPALWRLQAAFRALRAIDGIRRPSRRSLRLQVGGESPARVPGLPTRCRRSSRGRCSMPTSNSSFKPSGCPSDSRGVDFDRGAAAPMGLAAQLHASVSSPATASELTAGSRLALRPATLEQSNWPCPIGAGECGPPAAGRSWALPADDSAWVGEGTGAGGAGILQLEPLALQTASEQDHGLHPTRDSPVPRGP